MDIVFFLRIIIIFLWIIFTATIEADELRKIEKKDVLEFYEVCIYIVFILPGHGILNISSGPANIISDFNNVIIAQRMLVQYCANYLEQSLDLKSF